MGPEFKRPADRRSGLPEGTGLDGESGLRQEIAGCLASVALQPACMGTQDVLRAPWPLFACQSAISLFGTGAAPRQPAAAGPAANLALQRQLSDPRLREMMRCLRMEALTLEDMIPWNSVRRTWRNKRSNWRRQVKSGGELVPDLAARLKVGWEEVVVASWRSGRRGMSRPCASWAPAALPAR